MANHANRFALRADEAREAEPELEQPSDDQPPATPRGLETVPDTGELPIPFPGMSRRLGDRYEVLGLLRRGGMGAVYEGRQLGLDRRVAIKTLGAGVLASSLEVQRFRREARIIQGLTHPNTIRLYDHGETPEGVPYIVMEYIEGNTLEMVLRTFGRLPVETVVQIAKQVLGSLQEAHSKEITHRDIKPDNLMLCDQVGAPNFVKVLDFGLARVEVERPTLETGPGAALGTVHYMAPEQLRGQRATPASDLYGLALTLFELAVGRPAYDGSTAYEIATHHLSDVPLVLPDELRETRLGQVIAIAASKSPDDRFPSAAEMLAALDDTHPQRYGDGDTTGSYRAATRTAPAALAPSVIVADAEPARPRAITSTGRIRPVRPRPRLTTIVLSVMLMLATAAAAFALRLEESARHVERFVPSPARHAPAAGPATGPAVVTIPTTSEPPAAPRLGSAAGARVQHALERASDHQRHAFLDNRRALVGTPAEQPATLSPGAEPARSVARTPARRPVAEGLAAADDGRGRERAARGDLDGISARLQPERVQPAPEDYRDTLSDVGEDPPVVVEPGDGPGGSGFTPNF